MEITFVSVDDWTELFIDGKKELENHTLDIKDVLDAIGVKYDWRAFDGTAYEEHLQLVGCSSEDLSDVPATREEAENYALHS
jgi:hypothetical protein